MIPTPRLVAKIDKRIRNPFKHKCNYHRIQDEVTQSDLGYKLFASRGQDNNRMELPESTFRM